MSKRALVAGASGFIGSHLCDLLISKGYQVIGIDNLITGRRKNIEQALSQGMQFIEHDIRKPLEIDGVIDEIYNLASPASPVDFSKLPVFILETGSTGHQNMLELGRKKKARVLFASSSEVYGDAEVHPQTETYHGNVNTIGHRSCYDEAKRFGEALSVAYQKQYGVEVRIARIFNTYGPRMRPDDGRIIPNFFIQALQGQSLTIYGDGKQTRSFCYVSDQASGLFSLMQGSESLPVNIGNPIERSVLELAHTINDLTGNRAPMEHLSLPENDPKLRRPDISRAIERLGWKPVVNLETGLKHCFEYFNAELSATPGGIKAPTLG